jgi:hypothetical protein
MSGKIPGYGQEEPTEASSIQSLAELMGAKPASTEWSDAAGRAKVARPVVPLQALDQVAQELTTSPNNLARVGGRSLKIRLMTYRALKEKTR